jgi:predicted O-methyltransferase YrrM
MVKRGLLILPLSMRTKIITRLIYDRCFQLVRSGGLILVDNVLWYGRVADPAMDNDKRTQAIKAINQQIYHDDRVQISLIPIGDGLTIARKK